MAILMALPFLAPAQRDQNLNVWWSINTYREKYKMPPLGYKYSSQLETDNRLDQIQGKFEIPEEGFPEVCDGEVILQSESYMELMAQVTSSSELYFDRDVRYICVSTTKTDKTYYVVIRLWMRT